MDWQFVQDKTICELRVAGVLVRDGALLVQRERKGLEYALVGGHVNAGETTADALMREFAEELGVRICCKKLLWTEECFFSLGERSVHQIAFYYLIDVIGGDALPRSTEMMPQCDHDDVLIGWMPLEELPNIVIYPEFVKECMDNLRGEAKHFVTRASC